MQRVELPYAKSLANRIMVLRALRGKGLPEPDALWSGDMYAMRRVLEAPQQADGWRLADAGPAGTAYRFGMAYWAVQPGQRVRLRGDQRLRERPIKPLVDALRAQGALIESDAEGWSITGTVLCGGSISVDARLSSQFASALMLAAEKVQPRWELELPHGSVSAPYVAMTQKLSEQPKLHWPPERDWSAAMVFAAATGLTGTSVFLPGLGMDGIQGDSALVDWGCELGFRIRPVPDGVVAEAVPVPTPTEWVWDASDQPDLAMPAITAAALLGRPGRVRGLHTLNSKESRRLDATVGVLRSLGCTVSPGDDHVVWTLPAVPSNTPVELDSLDDHRMAFCAALVSLCRPVKLRRAAVVDKSFPQFWSEFHSAFGGQLELLTD